MFHRLARAMGQGTEGVCGGPKVVDRGPCRFEREATEPTHGRPLVAVWITAAKYQADAQRVVERDAGKLQRGRDHQRFVARIQRPAESGVRIAVAGHRTYVRKRTGWTQRGRIGRAGGRCGDGMDSGVVSACDRG
jgi:hypothetical protein